MTNSRLVIGIHGTYLMRWALNSTKTCSAVAVLLLLIAGCNHSAASKSAVETDEEWQAKREQKFPLIDGSQEPRLSTFAKADDWVSFLRLPDPHHDLAAYTQAAENESFLIDGLLFHEKSRKPLTDPDREQLAALLSGKSVFRTWVGTKLCGGFNPNVAIRWTFQKREYYLLTCFECKEVRVIGPEGTVTYDMEAPEELRELTKRYE